MALKWRKWNKAVHRDFGYLFLGMTIIYSVSGIAINHRDDWNPNYRIVQKDIQITPMNVQPDKQKVLAILKKFDEAGNYKNYYFPQPDMIKIFIEDGTVLINLKTGKGLLEKTVKRPILREVNYLHYNPIKYWTWFSDIYAGALILLGVTGILIPRESKSILKRGAWLTILGFIIPIIYLLIYFY